jgi:uncharacterized OB-fold protein
MNHTQKAICTSCGKAAYPPHACCPSCGGKQLRYTDLGGGATLLTFTRVHMLSLAYTERFITLGIAEFDDGTRALGRLDVAEPHTGMRLKAEVGTVRVQDYTEVKGLRFVEA